MPSFNAFLLAAALAMAPLNGVVAGPLHDIDNLTPRGKAGINCDGAPLCGLHGTEINAVLRRINKIPIGTTYASGAKLACAGGSTYDNGDGNRVNYRGGICAMIGHNTASYTVTASTNGQQNSAGDIVNDLVSHGCTACGTAPTNRVGNDLSQGSLVINYVGDVCGRYNDDACPPSS